MNANKLIRHTGNGQPIETTGKHVVAITLNRKTLLIPADQANWKTTHLHAPIDPIHEYKIIN